GDGDGVAAGLLLDDEADRDVAVESAQAPRLLDAVLDRGHVLDPHWIAVAIGDDDVREVLGDLDPAEGPQNLLVSARVHASAGQLEVLPHERESHVLDREPATAELRRLDCDIDRPRLPAD